MRNGNALTDGCGPQAFAVQEDGHQAVCLDVGMMCCQMFGEFTQHLGLRGAVQLGDDQFFSQDINHAHGEFLSPNPASYSHRRTLVNTLAFRGGENIHAFPIFCHRAAGDGDIIA